MDGTKPHWMKSAYVVRAEEIDGTKVWSCSCPDFRYRKRPGGCKHIRAFVSGEGSMEVQEMAGKQQAERSQDEGFGQGAAAPGAKETPFQYQPEHKILLQGKEYTLYGGLLAHVHHLGLQSIAVEIVQIPNKTNENEAIVKATVTLLDGRRFEELGDASPRNCNARVATACLRMAATRGKARAMRDATNSGEALVEGGDEHLHDEPPAAEAPYTDPITKKTYTRYVIVQGIRKQLERRPEAQGADLTEFFEQAPLDELMAFGRALTQGSKTAP